MILRFTAPALALLAASSTAQEMVLEPVASVPDPTSLHQPPGETDRLFVTGQQSGIYIVENGVQLSQPFLDLDAEAAASGGLHYFGVMDMTFHPDFQSNGRFYVTYMERTMLAHVVEYRVSASDPNLADPSTRVQILGPYPMTFQSHGWNQLWFGPDGMLYIATGDDQQTAQSTLNVSQDLSSVNGKILRLDVDAAPPYVPLDNPFVGTIGADERVFAYGLRQPWRMAHDPVTDQFFVGDVGAQASEEISVVNFASLAGSNFGWRCLEGTGCTNFAVGCPAGCNDPNRVDPVYEYAHGNGLCAVIGGVVYRGAALPSLQGQYVFADYCAARFWSFEWDGVSLANFRELTAELRTCEGLPAGLTVSFGTDNAGEMYLCDAQNDTVWKVVPAPVTENYCVLSPNSAGPGAAIGSTGSVSIGAGDFTLTASGVPAGALGLFYYGPNEVQVPLGNGTGCIGPGSLGFFRLYPAQLADANGEASYLLDFGVPPIGSGPGQVVAGSTWNFQFWFRDVAAGGAFYNFSDGLRARFCL